jgi:hypothetical protein
MENDKLINKELVHKYGRTLSGDPIYRLVQNHRSLTEKRKGQFDIYAGEIFIRTEYGVHEVPKYNYVEEGRWILEKFFNTTNPELCSNKTYEPLWVFQGPAGEYQRPNLKAVILIIESALRGPSEAVPTQAEQIAKETDQFYEMLGGKPSLDGSIASGEAVSYSGLNAKEKF